MDARVPKPGGGGGILAQKDVLGGLDTFESALRNGTRARREKEEFRVSELRASIREVELKVGEEAEKHVETARALQTWAETQVGALRVRLEEKLAESARRKKLSALADAARERRRKAKRSRGTKARMVESKRRRSETKNLRGKVRPTA